MSPKDKVIFIFIIVLNKFMADFGIGFEVYDILIVLLVYYIDDVF